ncbi:MAG: O-antigen ligase family protein [Methylococcales bacterium]
MAISWLASGQAISLFKLSLSQTVGKALALFLLILIIGCFYSVVNLDQSLTTLWSWRKLVYIFILFSIFNSLYWKEQFITIFICGMSFALLLSYLAWFEVIPSRKGVLGIIATNYTVQSMSFVVATICCIAQIPQASNKSKIIYTILALLFSINILYISESRTGYLSLFTGVLLAALLSFSRKKAPYIILGLVFVLTTTLFSSSNLQNRIKKGVDELQSYQNSPELTSIGIRVVFAKNTIELIKTKPILGYGTGSFGYVYNQHIANKYTDWRSGSTTDPHNQFLFVITENGAIGLLAFLGFIVIAIRQGIITDKFGTIAASILFAWVFAGLFNSIFKTFLESHLLSLFIGAMLAPVSLRPATP